jgi:glyoxylate reductase
LTPPRIFISRRLPSSVLDPLAVLGELDVWDGEKGPERAELLAKVSSAAALIAQPTDRVDAELLSAAPLLRVVANVAVGYDNVDLPAAAARQVVITNTPDVLTESCAAYTIGLILAVTRRITEGDRVVRAGRWLGWKIDFMLGSELAGRQLGVIGMGRIGRSVASKASSAFGMRVAYARSPRSRGDDEATPLGEGLWTPMSLDQLLHSSDIVTLHVPLSPETKHLINTTTLARMKRSAFLVNMARGPVVDEAALAWALREGIISGAALDVYEHEPTVHAELLGLPNVVLAPHLGSATRETRTAMADLAVKNVVAVLEGRTPLTPIPGSYVP